jgi:phosphate starvation-inducible protein PhoH
MKMMLTRLGDGSRMVITGDLNQSDRPGLNGLDDFIKRFRRFSSSNDSIVKYIEFENQDVQRSLAVSHVLNIYEDLVIHKKSNDIPNNSTNIVKKNYTEKIINNDAAMIPRSQYDIGYW